MIELKNVTKFYKTGAGKQYVLNNVTQTIPSHTNVGILGRNGAGKSTLLRMLGGIDFPNSGIIHSKNSFSWPMGLAGGFQGSMTGRQNVKFVCRIYGKSDHEINEAIEAVKEFSELGSYFDMPIKIYSSGMKSRLSFGLSLFFDFDYLIIDETLSVGDKNFQVKSKAALRKKIQNCNVLLVSHSMPVLQELCDAGIVVNDAKMHYFDDIKDAIAMYDDINKQRK
ncbi:ABC transporter ATP-binding protein [Sulfurimonas sp.]